MTSYDLVFKPNLLIADSAHHHNFEAKNVNEYSVGSKLNIGIVFSMLKLNVN